MEEFQEALQAALGTVPVYLGAENVERQPQVPHVIVVPRGTIYGPSDGSVRDAIATGTTDISVVCRAARFDEAEALADLVYAAAPGRAPNAKLSFRSEIWGEYVVRVADLILTIPTSLTSADISRVKVLTFTQHLDMLPLTPTIEVPNDQTPPDGHTTFSP